LIGTSGSGKNNDSDDVHSIRLGLRPNIHQFSILILVNAFVGAMIGLEQTVVPLLGRDEFGIESNALIVSFIASIRMAVWYTGSIYPIIGS
jgi:hypothetical protein